MFRVEKVLAVVLIAVLAGVLMYECLTPTGFLYPYREEETPEHRRRLPFGLFDTAHKVAESNVGYATRDTYQRKVYHDGACFFVLFLADVNLLKYVSSYDVVSWRSPRTLYSGTIYSDYGGSADIAKSRGTTYKEKYGYYDVEIWLAIHSLGKASYMMGYRIVGDSLSNVYNAIYSTTYEIQGGSIVTNLNGNKTFAICHWSNGVGIHVSPANRVGADTSVPYGGNTTGGNQLLPYKTSSPYNMLALAKGNDNQLYYNIVNETSGTFTNPSFTAIALLGKGFSDFCATSEAQSIGDPERVHLVYIKSTGELCYRKFESDVWSGETVLVEKGASYPVIAAGGDGRLYVFYVFNGVIKLLKFDGEKWLKKQVQDAFPFHTYNNPAYLSTNQVVQHGKICLVWTEQNLEGDKPYAVWFGYIEDG